MEAFGTARLANFSSGRPISCFFPFVPLAGKVIYGSHVPSLRVTWSWRPGRLGSCSLSQAVPDGPRATGLLENFDFWLQSCPLASEKNKPFWDSQDSFQPMGMKRPPSNSLVIPIPPNQHEGKAALPG
ncbi:hypothetical protein J1605_006850 [Eschrichtius robustus]|uniref:Uncharacterized protein n=1 Tax=Eschrichtius robustus TaxID=9764 RepID=A0AB34H4S4_ESCRO|nr:hypothetical protein J1605_006850 [Eschrichtius robustus]